MLFPYYKETKLLYHVVNINHLKNILNCGIKLKERKVHSDDKYLNFNQFLDKNRSEKIPSWVKRERAFFASLNFKKDTNWHSHSALLAIKINEEKCWVANENLANEIYDPFVLQHIDGFDNARDYMNKNGRKKALKYWENSLAFKENLHFKMDYKENYDAEVMIFHDIPPQDIKCLLIITDHQQFTPIQWQQHYN